MNRLLQARYFGTNPYKKVIQKLTAGGKEHQIYALPALGDK